MTAPKKLLFGNTTALQNPTTQIVGSLRLHGAHQSLLRSQVNSTWAAIDIIAPEQDIVDRDAVDIAIVLDCSGSMGQGPGSKLDHAVQATRFVLERLHGEDRAAIVAYGSGVEVVHSLSHDHQKALKHLDTLATSGMTALAAGLYQGIEQLGAVSTGRQRRVFLLSDGQANIGETDPERIAEQVAQAAQGGIIISTFGLGEDYNEDMMEAIAVAGRGGYYFLADPDQAPQAFNQELDDLFQLSLRGASLSWKSYPGVRIGERLGIDSNETAAVVGDLAAGSKRTLLIELECDPNAGARADLLDVTLTAEDTDGQPLVEQLTLSVAVVSDEQLVINGVDADVLARVTELQAGKAQAEAIRLADAGQFALAQQLVSTSQGQVQSFLANNAWVANADALNNKVAQLSANYEQLASDHTYDRRSRKTIAFSAYNTRTSRDR